MEDLPVLKSSDLKLIMSSKYYGLVKLHIVDGPPNFPKTIPAFVGSRVKYPLKLYFYDLLSYAHKKAFYFGFDSIDSLSTLAARAFLREPREKKIRNKLLGIYDSEESPLDLMDDNLCFVYGMNNLWTP